MEFRLIKVSICDPGVAPPLQSFTKEYEAKGKFDKNRKNDMKQCTTGQKREKL